MNIMKFKILMLIVTAFLNSGCSKTTEPEVYPPYDLVWVWFNTTEEPYQGDTRLETRKALKFDIDWTYELITTYRVIDSEQSPPNESESGDYEVRKATATYLIDGGQLSPLQSDSEIVFHPQDKEAYKLGWEIKGPPRDLILVRSDGYTVIYKAGAHTTISN